MPLTKQEWLALEKKAHELRRLCLDTTYWAGSGHIGGGMSVMDMLTVLYHKYLNLDVKNPDWEDRDRFILSKGHAGIAYAPVLVDYGWNDPEQHGLPIAIGTALAARVLGKSYKTYCILGDGECDEGSNWEAAMAASNFKVTNMISFVDRNKCMIDGPTEEVMKLEPFADKWRAFGFIVKEVDGHNFKELCEAIDFALENKTDSPVMIIANTIKGAGINFMEDNYLWHYGAIDEDMYKKAIDSLDAYYETRKARAEKEGE